MQIPGCNLNKGMKRDKREGSGILVRFIEKSIEILLKKECKRINIININIKASNLEILKGNINKIEINACEVNYKGLTLDEIKLETSKIDISYKIGNRKLNIKDGFLVKFKICLSEVSLKNILLSNQWSSIWKLISKEISDKCDLKEIKLKDDLIELLITNHKNRNTKIELVKVKSKKGKLYLESLSLGKSILIPIEDKIFIDDIYLKDNLINIIANSNFSF